MAVSRMRSKKYAIYPLLYEQFGRCAVAMRQIWRSTECVSSSMKKSPSNSRNFDIYKEIAVRDQTPMSEFIYRNRLNMDAYAHVQWKRS